MTKRILVAVDQSTLQPVVTQKAMEWAQALGAQLMWVHVLSVEEEGSPAIPLRSYHAYYPLMDDISWETYQHNWEAYEARGLDLLRRLTDQASELGIAAEFTQASGQAGVAICDVARTWEADLVMVGSRGRRGLSEFFLGSVSNYVMHHAPCSVIVVREAMVQEATVQVAVTPTEATVPAG